MITTEQRKAALTIVFAVSETIRELGSTPSGFLYNALMAKINLSFNDYQAIISTLKNAGVVKEANNVLTWIGPKIKE